MKPRVDPVMKAVSDIQWNPYSQGVHFQLDEDITANPAYTFRIDEKQTLGNPMLVPEVPPAATFRARYPQYLSTPRAGLWLPLSAR